MSSEGVEPAGDLRLHRLASWFDIETAAVVTILLGLFQVLLSVPLGYANITLPSIYILPLIIGIFIVAGGSITVANERNPSKLLLQGCACSNVISLLGTTLAFCLYCLALTKTQNTVPCPPGFTDTGYRRPSKCPGEVLAAQCWSVITLLVLYDTGAVLMHFILSVCALKALKKD